MEKSVATLGKGATCSSWNYCGQRLASGSVDGVLAIYDAVSSSSASVTSKVSEYSIDKVVWVPPEFGQGVACIFADGSFAIWEESAQDGQVLKWMQCAQFSRPSTKVLDLCFGVFGTRLKLVTAYSDGFVRVYELLDPLELSSWQLQVTCLSSSISWNPSRDESRPSNFVVGFNSDVSQLNSAKVWEFDDAHHRWLSLFLSSTLSSSMELAIAAAGEERCFPRKPRILLAASGSVAAIKFSNLCRCFSEWAEVRAVATKSSLHFIDTNSLPDDIVFYTDEDEWSSWKKIGDTVLHIELRRWADILVIAPLSANTLAKIAGGLCDNLLTCIVRAWDYGKPVFVAPAMNTFMWTNPFTERHLMAIDELGVSLIPPVTKRLACGDYGNGAMAEPSLIYSTVRLFAEHHSKSNNNH